MVKSFSTLRLAITKHALHLLVTMQRLIAEDWALASVIVPMGQVAGLSKNDLSIQPFLRRRILQDGTIVALAYPRYVFFHPYS